MQNKIYFSGLLILLLIINSQLVVAQEKPFQTRNAVYLELLGANRLYSLNYDRIILVSDKKPWLFGYRVGGSLAGKNLVKSRVVGELYALLGKHKNHLELGMSSSVGRNVTNNALYSSSANVLISPVIAYRLQEPNGPSCFRVSLNPFIGINYQETSRGILVGLSFGRSF
jgi:hypothetical protein